MIIKGSDTVKLMLGNSAVKVYKGTELVYPNEIYLIKDGVLQAPLTGFSVTKGSNYGGVQNLIYATAATQNGYFLWGCNQKNDDGMTSYANFFSNVIDCKAYSKIVFETIEAYFHNDSLNVSLGINTPRTVRGFASKGAYTTQKLTAYQIDISALNTLQIFASANAYASSGSSWNSNVKVKNVYLCN